MKLVLEEIGRNERETVKPSPTCPPTVSLPTCAPTCVSHLLAEKSQIVVRLLARRAGGQTNVHCAENPPQGTNLSIWRTNTINTIAN